MWYLKFTTELIKYLHISSPKPKVLLYALE